MTRPSRAELLAQLDSLRSMILALPEEATVQPESGNKVAMVILRMVSETFEVPINLILDEDRSHWIKEARFAAMKLIREFTRMNLQSIATFLHKKDHQTVRNGIKRMTEWCATEQSINERMNGLRARLRTTLRTLPYDPKLYVPA